jgi:nitrite reductase (NO-forming)
MLKTDAAAKQMLDKFKIPMPNQGLNDAEIKEFVAYFKWGDANVRPQGTTQPQPAAAGTALPPDKTLSAMPTGGATRETQSATDIAKERKK